MQRLFRDAEHLVGARHARVGVLAALVGVALCAACVSAHAQTLLVEKFDDGDSAPVGWTVLFTASATPVPPHENSLGDQFCHDGIDNDHDHLTDCRDPDCALVPPCGAAPVLSPHLNIILVGALSVVGAWLLARRQAKLKRE